MLLIFNANAEARQRSEDGAADALALMKRRPDAADGGLAVIAIIRIYDITVAILRRSIRDIISAASFDALLVKNDFDDTASCSAAISTAQCGAATLRAG